MPRERNRHERYVVLDSGGVVHLFLLFDPFKFTKEERDLIDGLLTMIQHYEDRQRRRAEAAPAGASERTELEDANA